MQRPILREVGERTLELPEPGDSVDEKLLSDSRSYGWHCIHVANGHHPNTQNSTPQSVPHPIYDAVFSYAVGLSLTRDCVDREA